MSNIIKNRLNVLESRIESLLIRMDRLYNAVHGVETKPRLGRPSKSVKSITDLEGTSYIVLSDGTVARRLKPKKNGSKKYYNLMIKGRLKAYNSDLFKFHAERKAAL
jgi:hypothetical protein